MIKSFRIKNFKSIRNIEISDVTPIILFGGKNNVGKTNILEALFLFYDRLDPQVMLRLLGFRGVIEAPYKPDVIFGSIFYNFNMNNEIKISIKENKLPEELIIKSNPEYVPQLIPPNGNSIETKSSETGQNLISFSNLDVIYEKSGQKKK